MSTLERFARLLAAVCLLLLAAAVSNAADPAPDTGAVEARTLLQAGRFEEALAILRPLARSHPQRTDILFLVGFAAMESALRLEDGADRDALLDEAVASLHSILVDQPGLVRVRLELARAFFLKGEDRLARRHFERVLAGDVPEAVAANVRRFLAQIRARRNWSVYLGAALAPDSNIGASSDEEIIYIYSLPFRRDSDELTTSGVGLQVWTGGEYEHPLRDRLRARAGVDLSRREHSGRRFDQTYLSGHVGPRWLVDGRTELSVLANARRRWAGGETNYDDTGVRLEAWRRLTPRVALHGRASWHRRDYAGQDHLDGPISDLSVGGTWVIGPTVRADVVAGFGQERPEALTWRNESRRIRASTSVALPRGFTVGANAELRWTGFEGNWFPFTSDGSSRDDRTRSLGLSLFNRNFTLYGFSPQVAVTYEVRRSTAQLHDYERTGGELRLVRQF